MMQSLLRRAWAQPWAVLLWFGVLCAVAVWLCAGDSGWDSAVYATAMRSLHASLDPYRVGTDLQIAVHNAGGPAPGTPLPWSYLYSPITLPLLRLCALVPFRLLLLGYCLVYAVAVLCQMQFARRMATRQERGVVDTLLPVALFFPGLLADGTLLSGNIAFVLYGAVLTAVWRGHRSGRWGLFYLAVLAASCFKLPMLGLLLLAPLLERRQWRPTLLTATGGIALFGVQPLLWPELFHNYLRAVELEFSINNSFGVGPAGLFSQLLHSLRLPYSPAGLLFHVSFAACVLLVLFRLANAYQAGTFSWREWMPVLLTGVVLLNPRIIEYDAVPLTVPLLLMAWRSFGGWFTSVSRVVAACIGFVLLNATGIASWNLRKWIDGPLLLAVFAAGVLRLETMARAEAYASAGEEAAEAVAA